MDRNKPLPSGRGPKGKISQQAPDTFIALGAKSSGVGSVDPKRTVPILPKQTSSSHVPSSSNRPTERKRDAPNTSNIPPPKKLKPSLIRPATAGSSSLQGDRMLQSHSGTEPWEALCIDTEPITELMNVLLESYKVGNIDKVVAHILGAIRTIRAQRTKPCKIIYNTLVFMCQLQPSVFTNEHIVQALVSCLRRDVTNAKQCVKSNLNSQILYVNLLYFAFNDHHNWPEVFLKLYIEDAVGERAWIENPYCKPFVENIITAFNTKHPPKALLASETFLSTLGRDTGSPLTINAVDDEETLSEQTSQVESWNLRVVSRFTHSTDTVEHLVLETVQEQLAKRQQPETVNKNFVRFLSTASGLVEIRVMAVARIETWLHNHKLMKAAQELLAYLCYNCAAATQRDLEVVIALSKLRLKNKQMVNFFNNCLREMVASFPDNLYPLMKYTVYNEFSNARNSNNLFVVGALFQVLPEQSADAFADICLELLLHKDDYLRSLRALLKELVRVLRQDFNLLTVVHYLLRERKEVTQKIRDSEFKERMFMSLTDLVCMCMLLCVTPQVRDAASQSKQDNSILEAFQTQVSSIQREAVYWLAEPAFKIFTPNLMEYQHALMKVVFLEQPEAYCKVDSWPGENERNLFLRLASEVPLLQATLLRLQYIGLAKENPIQPNEILEIIDQLVRRAANIQSDAPLVMDKPEIITFFFNLSTYSYHETIALPPGYVPPKLAISTHYWKSWLILLILAAHNPKTYGDTAWSKYPTLKMLMEMCITNHFSFPPPTMVPAEGSLDEFLIKEQQTLAMEKQVILELETHLAAASTKEVKLEINEQTSLLLSQLMELNPFGDARRPPQQVLDQLRNLSTTHRMGHLLCRSRNPDFLLNIMSRHSGTAQMPWLAELVHSSESALAHLPVQCLCEYLLSTGPAEKLTKHTQLLAHLRTVVHGSDAQMSCEVLEYLLRRLTSFQASNRAPAVKGLTLVLNQTDEEVTQYAINNTFWLTQYIPRYVHFYPLLKACLNQFLRQAILIETNPTHITNYIMFLCEHGIDDNMLELYEVTLDLASLIVERNSLNNYILPGNKMQTLKALIQVFYTFFQKAREIDSDAFTWPESPDHVIVQWANNERCTTPILIVHASFILLTYGPVPEFSLFNDLLNLWFPEHEDYPRAFLLETNEEALLVPDWLKLRMIRSNVTRLLDCAVEKLEASQLVLFIQSFGIPVHSMSKLLKVLDNETKVADKLVVESVLDKSYMIQLVDVQNRRGASGGTMFVKALEMEAPVIQDEGMNVMLQRKKQIVNFRSSADVINISVTAALERVMEGVWSNRDITEDVRFLCKELIKAPSNRMEAFKFLQRLPPQRLVNFLNIIQHSVPVLKLLYSVPTLDQTLLSFGHYMKTLIPQNTVVCSLLQTYMDAACKMETQSTSCIKTDQLLKLESSKDFISEKLLENGNPQQTGLWVDKLTSVELEIANVSCDQLHMDLLFSKKDLAFRPLLISIVLQRATWKILNNIVEYLLYPPNVNLVNATSALDFLTALTQCPRLWQGRDKSIPKHNTSECILYLNQEKLLTIIQYILEEARENAENYDRVIEKRLKIILLYISKNESAIVSKLTMNNEDIYARDFLLMLYMNLPSLRNYLTIEDISIKKSAVSASYSAVDVISHSVLSALTALPRSKDWNKRSNDLELCARKLTATHPELVIRQLPMLAGCLRGRSQYEWHVLKNRGHLLLFTQVLGLLELLEPAIFEQTNVLCSILDSYFCLLKFHGHSKDLGAIVSRLVVFLQNWMVRDIQAALKYLQQYGHILNDIELVQPSVRPLLSNVCLPIQDSSTDLPEQMLVGAPIPSVAPPPPPNWTNILAALKSSEPLSALQEVDHISSKRPQLLEEVFQDLLVCMCSGNSQVRSLGITLVVRLLKFQPQYSKRVLPTVLYCLSNRDADVAKSVLERLSELVVLMQEYAKIILSRVYELGVSSNLHAASNIARCVELLSLQSR